MSFPVKLSQGKLLDEMLKRRSRVRLKMCQVYSSHVEGDYMYRPAATTISSEHAHFANTKCWRGKTPRAWDPSSDAVSLKIVRRTISDQQSATSCISRQHWGRGAVQATLGTPHPDPQLNCQDSICAWAVTSSQGDVLKSPSSNVIRHSLLLSLQCHLMRS